MTEFSQAEPDYFTAKPLVRLATSRPDGTFARLDLTATGIAVVARALENVLPREGVRWSLEVRVGAPGTYRLRNDGDEDAQIVFVEGSPESVKTLATIRGSDATPIGSVVAGSSVVLDVRGRLTLTVQAINVSWGVGADLQSQVLQLPD